MYVYKYVVLCLLYKLNLYYVEKIRYEYSMTLMIPDSGLFIRY